MADGAVTLRHRLRAAARRRHRTVETKVSLHPGAAKRLRFCRSVRGARLHRLHRHHRIIVSVSPARAVYRVKGEGRPRALHVLRLFRAHRFTVRLKYRHVRDRFGTMLALGITFQFGVQAILNICVVTNTIPNTGISLPFFSFGGTALIMLLAEMGVLLSVSRHSNTEKM